MCSIYIAYGAGNGSFTESMGTLSPASPPTIVLMLLPPSPNTSMGIGIIFLFSSSLFKLRSYMYFTHIRNIFGKVLMQQEQEFYFKILSLFTIYPLVMCFKKKKKKKGSGERNQRTPKHSKSLALSSSVSFISVQSVMGKD